VMAMKHEAAIWKSKETKAIQKRISKVRSEKPRCIREESWRYKRVKDNWRKPKGIDSKMRKRMKGRPVSPLIGRRSPRNLRNRHPSGLYEVLVCRTEELKTVNPQTHVVRIAGRLGSRKKASILEEARKLGIKILNPTVKARPKKTEEEEEAGEKPEEETKEDYDEKAGKAEGEENEGGS